MSEMSVSVSAPTFHPGSQPLPEAPAKVTARVLAAEKAAK